MEEQHLASNLKQTDKFLTFLQQLSKIKTVKTQQQEIQCLIRNPVTFLTVYFICNQIKSNWTDVCFNKENLVHLYCNCDALFCSNYSGISDIALLVKRTWCCCGSLLARVQLALWTISFSFFSFFFGTIVLWHKGHGEKQSSFVQN